MDLKNAFGEVSHFLISTVLQFHHNPQEIQNIISELCSGFSTSIATKTFVTSPLQVEKGGFESNIAKNEVRKRNKYRNLTQSLKSNYDQVKYINLSLGGCGIIGKGSEPFFDLLEELKVPDNEKHFLTKQNINICHRTTYYVFCMCNKEWSNPELLQF